MNPKDVHKRPKPPANYELVLNAIIPVMAPYAVMMAVAYSLAL